MIRLKELFSVYYLFKTTVTYVIILCILVIISLSLSYNLHMFFTKGTFDFFNTTLHIKALSIEKVRSFFIIFIISSLLFILYLFVSSRLFNGKSGVIKITPQIKIPSYVNSTEFGSSRFMSIGKAKKDFSFQNIYGGFTEGGIYLGCDKSTKNIFSMTEDTHSLVIGSTGPGKTRCLVIQSIVSLAKAGESMIISDPKSELYIYTSDFLKGQGYSPIVLDFIQFAKSNRYNFLQPIIDAVNANNIPLAITRTNDLTAALVQSDRTNESLWTDGERSVIACAIMAVVYDNRNRPLYQTMANVYHFLANMCKSNDLGFIPLNGYILDLPDNHPAKSMVAISEIAPSKMRGSFYTSALTTLYLFTTPDIHNMTLR